MSGYEFINPIKIFIELRSCHDETENYWKQIGWECWFCVAKFKLNLTTLVWSKSKRMEMFLYGVKFTYYWLRGFVLHFHFCLQCRSILPHPIQFHPIFSHFLLFFNFFLFSYCWMQFIFPWFFLLNFQLKMFHLQ